VYLQVFLTVRTVGVPHVAPEDRYLVDRVRTFSGLYIATIRFGYRDIKSLEDVVHPLRDRIVALEARSDPANLDKKVRIIDESIETAVTHIVSLIFRNTHFIVELAAYPCLLSISYRTSTLSPIPLRRNLESFATSASSSSKRSTVASRSTLTNTSNTASEKIKMCYECRLSLPSRSPFLSHPRSHASSHHLYRPLCLCQVLETCLNCLPFLSFVSQI